MQELKWNDEVDRYDGTRGAHRYYGHIKNPQNLVYICDKEERVHIHHEIVEGLQKIQNLLKEYEEKGYQYFYPDIDCGHDDSGNGGRTVYYIELQFYRLETREEQQERFQHIKQHWSEQLTRLKKDVEEAHQKLVDMKERLK